VVGLVLLGLTIGTAVGTGGLLGTPLLLAVATLLVAAGAVWCLLQARRATRRAWAGQASALLGLLRERLGELVDERLVAPTRAVLADHRSVRRAAEGVEVPMERAAGPEH
jgi:hypothetical protein